MLDPAEYDDVIVTVAHPWGDIDAPLPTWILGSNSNVGSTMS